MMMACHPMSSSAWRRRRPACRRTTVLLYSRLQNGSRRCQKKNGTGIVSWKQRSVTKTSSSTMSLRGQHSSTKIIHQHQSNNPTAFIAAGSVFVISWWCCWLLSEDEQGEDTTLLSTKKNSSSFVESIGTATVADVSNNNNTFLLSTFLHAMINRIRHTTSTRTHRVQCDYGDNGDSDQETSFLDCLEYHRSLLFDYERRWSNNDTHPTTEAIAAHYPAWPRNVPNADQISALEMDLHYCQRHHDNNKCHETQFRVASYYVLTPSTTLDQKRRGVQLLHELATTGHSADAMCLYGILYHRGSDTMASILPHDPTMAVLWWRRAGRHVVATYELASAYYLGTGSVVEDAAQAAQLFLEAAHWGHAGAAYMVGECILEQQRARNKADALEWLVTAAELGHALARRRVLALLREEKDDDARWWGIKEEDEETATTSSVNIERRHTLGPSTPAVLARRNTKIDESRETG